MPRQFHPRVPVHSAPLAAVYRALFERLGPQRWWPARTDTEMMIGAVLVQNTAWTAAEKAIANLRAEGLLDWLPLAALPRPRLSALIRPAGFLNLKAERLHNLARLLVDRFGGRNASLFALPTDELRATLLGVKGIGPETADCILLYAARRPVFVVDAYTRRFLSRHGWIRGRESYDEVARLFTERLDTDEAVFNECHALIVELGKRWCRTRAECETCPLRRWPRVDD